MITPIINGDLGARVSANNQNVFRQGVNSLNKFAQLEANKKKIDKEAATKAGALEFVQDTSTAMGIINSASSDQEKELYLNNLLKSRRERLAAGGRDTSDTDALLSMPFAEKALRIKGLASSLLDSKDRLAAFGLDASAFTLSTGQERFDGSGNRVAANIDELGEKELQEKIRSNKASENQAQIDSDRKNLIELAKLAKEKGTDNFDKESKMRDKYVGLSQGFSDSQDAYSKVLAAASDPSGASDIALVTSFMKVLDPGSVVREGEFAVAASSAGLSGKFISMMTKLDNGQFLTPEQRKDFVSTAKNVFKVKEKSHKKLTSETKRIAKRNGLDTENIIVDLSVSDPGTENPNVQQKREFTSSNGIKFTVGK